MHLYATPHSLSWIIFLENGSGGMEWSGPASYVKIRDELYLAYWLEEACNGTLGTILINLRTMRNCGVDYSAGPKGLRLGAVGAHVRLAGRFDVLKYFQPMTKQASTRRSFIQTTGAALSLPLTAVAATVPAAAADDGDPLAARLARLEDLEAIRALNQAFTRQVSAGQAEALGIDPGIRIVAAHEFGERDVIELLPGQQTATCRLHCAVQIETVIGPSCPLVEMAREQGGGVVTRSEIAVFENACVKRDGVWTIQRSAYRRDA